MKKRFGGIEAGGTKFICAVGSGPDDIIATARFPTTNPDTTLNHVIEFFLAQIKKTPLTALGIASFGPIDLKPVSTTYGYITSTPKIGWSNTDLAKRISAELNVVVGFDTDVNGAALGENKWGAAQGLDTFIYLTIGTGIGGGAMVGGKRIHGLVHPEMGHLLLPHDFLKDPFPGICPYHKDCFEGLASGPAIEARWGEKAENLPPDHPAWDLEAEYLSLALHGLICTLSPQRIILGGGIMNQPHLFKLVQQKTKDSLNNYVGHEEILKNIESYIVPPGLGNQAGVLGAIALAQESVL